jgi:ATP-dependent Lon protease
MFIATANTLQTIPPPLLDRMEVIQLSGYTVREKLEIARRYLLPEQLREHVLTEADIVVTDDALRVAIEEYTREAGVRNLEREIANICRKVAVEVARASDKLRVTSDEPNDDALVTRHSSLVTGQVSALVEHFFDIDVTKFQR